MKKFLIQITIFSLFPLSIFLGIFAMADGYTDPYYTRFTSPDQSNLILGTSRSAQGLEPSVFESILQERDFFNYSFTLGHSPYGPVYFESIKRKLDQNTKNGIFILAVDPWSLSSISSDPNNPATFREVGRFVDNLETVSMNPNIFYLLNEYQGSYFRIVLNYLQELTGNPAPKPVYVHKDGWLEINVPMDSASVTRRTQSKFQDYRNENLPSYKKSSFRVQSLEEIITYLKQYGSVYIVRLPVPDEMIDIEAQLWAGFDEDMMNLSNRRQVEYFSFSDSGEEYTYTDGNHLYLSSSKKVSADIASRIKNTLPKP